MSKRIIIVHGIHTNDNTFWMDYLVQAFKLDGWDAQKWTYGYAYASLTRFQNPGRAKKLMALIQPGDVVLGHSNGGCLTWMAAELGAPMGGAILINPALDTDKVLAKHVKWVNLYCNAEDEAVPWASVFIGHPWGPQGKDGISIDDQRYNVVDSSDPQTDAPSVKGHSAVFEAGVITAWSKKFINDANNRINSGGN